MLASFLSVFAHPPIFLGLDQQRRHLDAAAVSIDADVEATAHKAQRELARVGHHRMSPIDLMIAACAHEAGMGILHYDRDYDRILELTSLSFESVWVAPAGSL